MNQTQESIVHGQQDDIHPTDTLCGKKQIDYCAAGESCLNIPLPRGIADPTWITCPALPQTAGN